MCKDPVVGGSTECVKDKEEGQGAGVQPGREKWAMNLKRRTLARPGMAL